jgi:hypothetical protein
MILQVLIAMIAGWTHRHQQQVIAYLLEENRTLHAKLGDRRIRFTKAERRRLAALAFPLGRKRLKSLATLATPDTLMHWYKRLIAQKFDGSQKRSNLGRPRVSEFTMAFDQDLPDQGMQPVVLPRQSPNLNAHCERVIRSVKEEALSRMIFMGEGSLRYALAQYLTHYHQERNHQGLDNQLIAPAPEFGVLTGEVRRRERLGGLLSYYYREAA